MAEKDNARNETYVAYMLRLWQSGSQGGLPLWRASLEDPATGERLMFGDLNALFAFLSERTRSIVEGGETSTPHGHIQSGGA